MFNIHKPEDKSLVESTKGAISQNVSDDTQEMPQSGNTAFRRHQKNRRQGTSNEKKKAGSAGPCLNFFPS